MIKYAAIGLHHFGEYSKTRYKRGIRQAEYKFYKTEDYNYNKKFVIALFSYLTEPCQVKDLFQKR